VGQLGPSDAVASDAETDLAILRRRNADLEVLYETIQDLTSTLSAQEVLDRLLERALHHLDSEIGSVLVLDQESRLRVVAARGLPGPVVAVTDMGLGEGISGYVAASERALLVDDIEEHPRFHRPNHERYYTRSFISSPLVVRKRVLGVLNVNNKRSRSPFVPSDLRLLEAISAHAAIALANAYQYEETLRRAQRDALTSLANHGHFFERLAVEVERAKRYERDLALVMIDVDHFKKYNDRLGHRAGDQALVRVARLITARSRIHDLVARYGGEEFAVILPETPLDGAVLFGEKIRRTVEGTGFGPDDRERLTVSVGIADLAGDSDASDLVEAADAELYRAKSEGRNRVCALRRDSAARPGPEGARDAS
jgi:diguanylate cyclase (GGDEF)-like protein